MTFVSVIIPTFNKSPLVCDTVQKLREQTFKDFEILVCDDGSTDDTVRSIKYLRRQERHLKIKVLQTGLTNIFGMCTAINMGLKHASGPLSLLVNDDIYLHPTCIEQHVMAHKRTGSRFAFLGPRFRCPPHIIGQIVADEQSRRYHMRKYTEPQKSMKGYPVYRKKMMVSSNLSIGTQTLCDIGGYNEFFRQYTGAIDRDLYHRLTLARIRVLFLYNAQAYSIRYDNATYRQTNWVQNDSLHGGVSIEDWKRQQMRYSVRQELNAREHKPPQIERRRA